MSHQDSSPPNGNSRQDQRVAAGAWHKKIAALVVVVLVIAAGYFVFRDALTLENLASREAQLQQYQQQHPVLVYGMAFLIYVLVTGFSLPGAAVLTLVYGWYFKLLRATILVSFASTAGATMAFLLSRYLLRDVIQARFGERLQAFNEALDREGAFYLFSLRLIPAVPFFVINVVMGLTRIPTRTFWWVSQVGMLAGTIVYAYAGSQVPDLQTLADQGVKAVFSPAQLMQITIAFVILGLFPLVVKKVFERWRPPSSTQPRKPDAAHQ